MSIEDGATESPTFPMVDGPRIPMELAEQLYSIYTEAFGAEQSLTRIGERGGFYWAEVAPMCEQVKRRTGKLPYVKHSEPRNRGGRARSFWDLSQDVMQWANRMFPNATAVTIAKHIKLEIDELVMAPNRDDEALELADIQMLLIHFASLRGIDLIKNCWEKLSIVKTREYVLGANGIHEHKRGAAGER